MNHDNTKEVWKELERAAEALNLTSDALRSHVHTVEERLNHLNLGVRVVVSVPAAPNSNLKLKLGYGRNTVSKKWELFIEDADTAEQWPFMRAPRYMIIRGIDAIPELLENMGKAVAATIDKLNRKLPMAKEMAAAAILAVDAVQMAERGTADAQFPAAKRPLDASDGPPVDPGPPETHVPPAKPLTGATSTCWICASHDCPTCHTPSERCPCARDGRS